MKKVLFTLIAATMVFCGCNKSKQFEVSLNLENADGQTVYLCKTVDGNDLVVDSAVITDQKAMLTAPNDDPQTLYIIKFDKNAGCGGIFTFFTENQNTTITGVGDDFPHWTLQGCQTMNELMDHHEKAAELYESKILALYAEMMVSDSAKVEALNAEVQPLIKEYFDYQVEFIRSHSDSYIGHFMLDEIKMDIDFELVKELANSLTNESVFRKNIQKYIEEGPQMAPQCCQTHCSEN